MVRNRKVVPTTWISDSEFIGTATFRGKRRNANGIFEEFDHVDAVYGWSRIDRAVDTFNIYTIDQGHISKLGTMKRNELLDFRSVTV